MSPCINCGSESCERFSECQKRAPEDNLSSNPEPDELEEDEELEEGEEEEDEGLEEEEEDGEEEEDDDDEEEDED